MEKHELKEIIQESNRELAREMRDFVHQEISASEKRVEERILVGVSEILHDAIAPKLDNHEVRIEKLEKTTIHA